MGWKVRGDEKLVWESELSFSRIYDEELSMTKSLGGPQEPKVSRITSTLIRYMTCPSPAGQIRTLLWPKHTTNHIKCQDVQLKEKKCIYWSASPLKKNKEFFELKTNTAFLLTLRFPNTFIQIFQEQQNAWECQLSLVFFSVTISMWIRRNQGRVERFSHPCPAAL